MYYLFIMRQVICLFVYIGNVCLHWKNPRFTAFFNSNLHTRLAIVTANELGLAFPPRNLPKKISSRSVHVLFSYRGNKQTNRQTDRQTNAGKNIIPRFRGDNYLPVDYLRHCSTHIPFTCTFLSHVAAHLSMPMTFAVRKLSPR